MKSFGLWWAWCLASSLSVAFAQSPQPLSKPDALVMGRGEPSSVVAMPDGGYAFAGRFDFLNGQRIANIGRVRADGSTFGPWTPPALDSASHLLADASGNLFVSVYIPGSNQQYRTTKLSSVDGSTVAGFSLVTGPNLPAFVEAGFVYLSAGEINGQTANRITRVSTATGQIDVSWEPAVPGTYIAGRDSALRTYIVNDGAQSIRRVSPEWTLDPTFQVIPPNPEAYLFVRCIGEHFLYVFEIPFGGLPPNQLRLRRYSLEDGSLDAEFRDVVVDANVIPAVYEVDAATVLVASNFYSINGRYLPLARLNATGDLAANQPDLDGGVFDFVDAVDGFVIVGTFSKFEGVPRLSAAKLATDLASSTAIGEPLLAGTVRGFSRQRHRLLVAGDIVKVDGHYTSGIARFLADGRVDTSWSTNLYSPVYSLSADSESSAVFAAGFVYSVDTPYPTVVKLEGSNGAVDPSWSINSPGYVSAVLADAGSVIVAGRFSTLNGVAKNSLGRVSASAPATVQADWPASTPATIFANLTRLRSSGDGYFCLIANGIERFESATGLSSWKLQGSVSDAASHGANLYVGGSFCGLHPPGQPDPNQPCVLAKVSAETGVVDPEWSQDSDLVAVYNLAVTASGDLYAAGDAFQLDKFLPRVNKFMPSGAQDPNFNPTLNGFATRLQLDEARGKLWVGGQFTEMSGVLRASITFTCQLRARWRSAAVRRRFRKLIWPFSRICHGRKPSSGKSTKPSLGCLALRTGIISFSKPRLPSRSAARDRAALQVHAGPVNCTEVLRRDWHLAACRS